jgi:peptidoglycan hydrolase FlgJ
MSETVLTAFFPPTRPYAPATAKPSPADGSGGLEQTCRDFESIFIHHMLQQMRRTVPRNDLFGGGKAEEMMTGMMDAELSKSIAQQRSLGLASILYRQLNTEPETQATQKKLKFEQKQAIPIARDVEKASLQGE